MQLRYYRQLLLVILTVANIEVAQPDPAPFDLVGPTLRVTVTRGVKTLPVSEVPNLAVGDRLWIHPELPPSQSAHYLMIAAFLRGSTNPPPPEWFFRCETWSAKCARDGLTVVVPHDAQQLLVFLAPQTGGDFKTLLNAVRGRPGAFVRTSQDLNQATLDRSRLESYLLAIRALNVADPTKLKDTAPLLARSLAIKVDDKCLDRIPALQAACLMQGQNSLIMDDGHSTSIVEALTSGPASDLAMEASSTAQLGYGYYSPYIASVLDIARILDSFHTAQYQYIPALTAPHADELALALNTPPSFHDPKSVLVVALPAVEQPQLPPLHAVDPKEIFCARRTVLALPVEGAPLVFSTSYAHDIVLTLSGKDGKSVELPARADAARGGFVIDTAALVTASLGDRIHGSLHGYWGFDKYDGPAFELVSARAQAWEIPPKDAGAMIVGRMDTVHLQAGSVSCIDSVVLKDSDGREVRADWKTTKPTEVEVRLPLEEAKPGPMTLLVTQFGASGAQSVQLHAFAEVAHLDRFAIHAGDAQGILKGSRLDEVASLVLNGIDFVPGILSSTQGSDELPMRAADASAASALKRGDIVKARVTLKDGRALDVNAGIDAPRPSVTLIGKSVQPSLLSSTSHIQLSNQDELPQDARLNFSVRARSPATFAYDEEIEVATLDGSASTALSLGNGGITLGDAKVAVATFDPARAFGPSAFGALQFRVTASGVKGDWQPLATLVRLPVLKELICPVTPELACKLTGSNLFLLDSVSSGPQFDHPVQVPDGFPAYALPVPHPTNGQLYVKLRDDPSVVNIAALEVRQAAATGDLALHAVARDASARAESEPRLNTAGQQAVEASPTDHSPAPSYPAQAQQPQRQVDPAQNSNP